MVKVRYANIINIISNYEVIPELLQSKCNSKNIYELFNTFIMNPNLGKKQVSNYQRVLKEIKPGSSSSEKVPRILLDSI